MDRSEIRLEISNYCKRLAFSQNPVRLCDVEASPKQEEFLYRVFRQEIEHRERMQKDRLFRKAAFPVRKTLESYEFNQIRLPSAISKDELTSCQFIRDKRNLVLYGPVGTGKTHLEVIQKVRLLANEYGAGRNHFKRRKVEHGGTDRENIEGLKEKPF